MWSQGRANEEISRKSIAVSEEIQRNYIQILREKNMEADALAKEALADQPMNEFDEVQYIPSIDIPEVLQYRMKEIGWPQ